jgi:hypothetical protein
VYRVYDYTEQLACIRQLPKFIQEHPRVGQYLIPIHCPLSIALCAQCITHVIGASGSIRFGCISFPSGI